MTRRVQRPQGGRSATPQSDSKFNEPSRQAGGRWRVRNWRLRTKLMAALLIPVVTLLVLLGLRVQQDLARRAELSATAAGLDVTAELTDLIHALQLERTRSVRFVASGGDGGIRRLRAARDRVDSQAGQFDRALAGARERLTGSTTGAFERVDLLLRGLADLRYSVEHGAVGTSEVLDDYSKLITGLLNVADRTISAISDTTLARYRLAGSALARMYEQHAAMRAVLTAALVDGELSGQRTRALLAARAKLNTAQADFRTFATPGQERMYRTTVRGAAVRTFHSVLNRALAQGGQRALRESFGLNAFSTAAARTVELFGKARDTLHAQLIDRVDTLRGRARTAVLIDLGLLLVVALLGGVLAIVVARSLLRPMRTLRQSALEVAEERLPDAVRGILTDSEPWPDPGRWERRLEPVPVFSREELGQIARAFDAVHHEAVRLAGEQAMLRENVNSMFVNLSRRSQDLVERQLAVLDRMEADEQDSETLGGLFELDHLATRMRRNSENLLVLSGQELEYPVEGAVTAEEVIGAALSEVEQYQRVRVHAGEDLSVAAALANDLVHVLSELLENATVYSPEESEVSLAGSLDDSGDWLIGIVDSGAGMAEVEVQRANRRLADPPEVDVEVSRRMGLYVVARLAHRHGVGVWLSVASTGGISANVRVPARLVTLVRSAAVPAPAREPDTSRPSAPPEWPFAEEPRPAGEARPEQDAERSAEPAAGPAAGSTGSREDSATEEHSVLPIPSASPAAEGVPVTAESVERAEPTWPAEDSDPQPFGPHPLQTDAPTDRLPAYRDVLADWFQLDADGTLGDLGEGSSGAVGNVTGEVHWPVSVDSVWVRPRADAEGAEALPKRVPGADNVLPPAETPAMDETPVDDSTVVTAELPLTVPVQQPPVPDAPTVDDLVPVSRSADDVRTRMSGLQEGLQRGRQESTSG